MEVDLDKLLSMNLAFFNQGSGDKTEKPTPKRRQKAREEGQVVQSQELGTAFLFITVFIALRIFAPMMINRISGVMHYNFTLNYLMVDFTNISFSSEFIWQMFFQIILIFLPLALVVMGVGLFINIIQVGWKPTSKPLKPKFSKLNPIKGIKKVFSAKMFVELFKALLKFSAILFVVYFSISSEINMIGMLVYMDLFQGFAFIGNLALNIGLTVGILYIFIAAIDYFFNRRKHEKELRMSKQELKEEYKQMEGDPQIKGKIRQKMRETSMRRMMQDIPGADVVITNPTHYAIALKYDTSKSPAPIVVAKGAGYMAARIKEKAKENLITIFEDKPLARTLYATVDVGDSIPPELYAAVAEILAYVYRLKNMQAAN